MAIEIDFKNILINFGEDEDLLKSTINLSMTHLPKYLNEIQNALIKKDLKALEVSAHTLKGSLSIYLYKPITQLAFELENMGREGRLEGAEEKLNFLAAQVNDFLMELKKYNNL